MKTFAIVGLGSFGRCMLTTLIERDRHVIVIDRDGERLQRVRDIATKAIRADAVNYELLVEVLPERVDCAIVDLGDVIGQSILVTNYLHKLNVPMIVVEAVSEEHAEILRIVGATRVVFPEKEAAERVAGMMVGGGLVDFFAVSKGFCMIEIPVPDDWVGKNASELKLRQKIHVDAVALRPAGGETDQEQWRLVDALRPFQAGEIVLLAGHSKDIDRLKR